MSLKILSSAHQLKVTVADEDKKILRYSDRKDLYTGSEESTSFTHTVTFFEPTPIDYLYLQRLNLIAIACEGIFTLTFKAISESGETTVSETVNINDMLGVNKEDYIIETPDLSDLYTGYELEITTTTAIIFQLGSVIAGAWWHPDSEPSYPIQKTLSSTQGQSRKSVREYSLNWKKINYQHKVDFQNAIATNSDIITPILYETNDLILDGYRLIECTVENVRVDYDSIETCNLSANFRQVL